MDGVIVSHTHWDREWYRTFQAFRARLVDTIDRVLDQLDRDPGWKFVLDGQTIVLEDYLAIRPRQADRIRAAVRSGRLAIGPWYVQPDSLLPGGETHVRNLLEGRRVGEQFGPTSRVAYTPDSFGHPAQFPQLFAGFGLDGFTYWRGNGAELDTLPPVYHWVAPDGSSVVACLLTRGYFCAAYLPTDVELAVKRLRTVGEELIADGATRLLFMNGVDHAMPDLNTDAVSRALAEESGWNVTRGRLEDFVTPAVSEARARFEGELLGGRITNVLPGVWSSRTYLKLANRAAETALVGWAEPWSAIGSALGLADETPALRVAWRALLANQAHDSIGGCSQDRVHRQMTARSDEAVELAGETTDRVLSRLAGLGPDRLVPWSDAIDVAVFNPSPHPRTDVVRFAIEGHPHTAGGEGIDSVHPLTLLSVMGGGIDVDGEPARVVQDDSTGRFRLMPDQRPWTVEWVTQDVPAFGWRRYRVGRGERSPDTRDDGRSIETDRLTVVAADDGTFTVSAGGQPYPQLVGVEDTGDRGDTYDFDPVDEGATLTPRSVTVERRTHQVGVQELRSVRIFEVPARLSADRSSRSSETVEVTVDVTARVHAGGERVDLDVTIDNTARDHRMRLAFPTGAGGAGARALTTFDIADRSPRAIDATGWVQPPPKTFPQQGWVHNNGLTIAAPGLPEAEVTDGGIIYLTAVRAVGWLSRIDLRSRPAPAGPGLRAPEAQCLGPITARLALLFGPPQPRAAWNAELGLRAVPAGPAPILAEGASTLTLEGDDVVLSAIKAAEDGNGMIVRVLNPTEHAANATLRFGIIGGAVEAVQLDESAAEYPLQVGRDAVSLVVPPHALRSIRLVPR
ncbi:MAG: glycoside hydrolase family 38 N-terminal domain-containing protein [Acidimicrobiales bacterium]